MKNFIANFLLVKEVLFFTFFSLLFISTVNAQANQYKAEQIVLQYLSKKSVTKSSNLNIKFSPIKVLRSSFEETKTYKNLLYKVDSLKIEGKHIDARIVKMKTTAELNQAKKDSYRLSKELTVASDQLVDFITSYKGQQIGWLLKTRNQIKGSLINSKSTRRVFYLNQELTQVDSIR